MEDQDKNTQGGIEPGTNPKPTPTPEEPVNDPDHEDVETDV